MKNRVWIVLLAIGVLGFYLGTAWWARKKSEENFNEFKKVVREFDETSKKYRSISEIISDLQDSINANMYEPKMASDADRVVSVCQTSLEVINKIRSAYDTFPEETYVKDDIKTAAAVRKSLMNVYKVSSEYILDPTRKAELDQQFLHISSFKSDIEFKDGYFGVAEFAVVVRTLLASFENKVQNTTELTLRDMLDHLQK